MDRRTVLTWFVRGIGLATAAVIGLPSLVTALSPLRERRRRDLWLPVGPMDAFEVGSTVEAVVELPDQRLPESLRRKLVYVWRPTTPGEGEVVVFSRNCTDLGCPVNYDPGSACFFCPCHGGIFDQAGNRMAGPPNRPLYRYAWRVRGGVLEIDADSAPVIT